MVLAPSCWLFVGFVWRSDGETSQVDDMSTRKETSAFRGI